MKTYKKHTKKEADFSKNLFRILSKKQITDLLLTQATMSEYILDFIQKEIPVDNIPIEIRYSILQILVVRQVLCAIVMDVDLEDLNIKCDEHLPMDASTEDKFIFIVKKYYDQLKKDGKV